METRRARRGASVRSQKILNSVDYSSAARARPPALYLNATDACGNEILKFFHLDRCRSRTYYLFVSRMPDGRRATVCRTTILFIQIRFY